MGDEGSSSKLDNLSKEELIKLVKKYMILHKQLRNKNEDLSNKLDLLEKSKTETVNNVDNGTNENLQQLKELQDKLDELSISNKQLNNENLELKSKIQSLNDQIVELNASVEEYKSFKLELEPQLENARYEISLNKSMLEMLNKEIKLLSDDKLKLEKRLLKHRSNTTPSVIVEEEEEDLEEEKRNDEMFSKGLKSIDEETNENIIQDETDNIIEMSHQQTDNDQDIEYLHQNGHMNNDGILMQIKQIEELTFNVDELKSDLEAEIEKNAEYLNEINSYKQKINDLENKLNLVNLKSTTNNELSETNETNNQILDDFKLKSIKFLEYLRDEFLNNQSDYQMNSNFDLDDIQKSLIEKLNDKLVKKDLKIKEESDRVKYVEQQLEKMILDFRTEINNLETNLNECKNSKQEIENKLKSVQAELDSEKEKLKAFHGKYEKYEKEASKNKVLDLEIADYEKSIRALNIQIISKDKEINDIKNELNLQNDNIVKLKQQLESIEKDRDAEKEKSTKLKQLLVKAKKDVSEAKAHEAEHLSNDASMRAQLESLNLEIENYKIQIADLIAERQKLQDRSLSNSDAYQRTTQLLETKIKSYEIELEDSKSKYENLKTEYDNYKIKVQHAFKKQKEINETNSIVSNGNESQKYLIEIEQLKSVILKLNEKLEENQDKIKLLEKENELTQDEYSRTLERNTKLLAEIKEKESEWKLKNQELLKDTSLKTDEVNEIIRNLRLQNEAQATQYKEKIKQLNTSHCQSIDILQSQLEETKSEIESLNRQIEELRNRPHSPVSFTPNNSSAHLNNLQHKQEMQQTGTYSALRIETNIKNNFILGINDRQLSEKSDVVDYENKNSTKSIEQLLSEPTTPSLISPNFAFQNDSKALLTQIDALKTDLSKAKIQLDHLNELLNESELNNVRLSEQINLLKDEIRRLERNQEREKSISNMEYLKNVVYKFLTFSTPQEKTQLLPVLTTMLKLSQEEQNAIMNYAKASNHIESTGSGWSTYLPKWSS